MHSQLPKRWVQLAFVLISLMLPLWGGGLCLAQEHRGFIRWGNLVVRQADIVAVVVRDPREKTFAVDMYCRQSTGDITAVVIPANDPQTSIAIWRAFATLPTPQRHEGGLVKCGELLVLRAEALTAALRIDAEGKPGTISHITLQLDTKTVQLSFVESINTREQVTATWEAITGLAGF